VHAFAAAIDINVKTADYWRWSKPAKNGVYRWRNRIPMEIVAIFERHGFIWGGRWYHYDTMHFEYRPELLSR
ncbi:MAG: M15 family metallopeptidase, partial [Hyphomicrobiales bacterium]